MPLQILCISLNLIWCDSAAKNPYLDVPQEEINRMHATERQTWTGIFLVIDGLIFIIF